MKTFLKDFPLFFWAEDRHPPQRLFSPIAWIPLERIQPVGRFRRCSLRCERRSGGAAKDYIASELGKSR